MFERFTDLARKVMSLANQEAIRFNHEYIGTEHLLLGLVKEGTGVGSRVLKEMDVDLRKVRLEVEKLVKSGPDMQIMGKLPQSPRAQKAIEYAIEEARHLNHNYVGTEHLLLGLLREHDGVAATVLMSLGLKLEEVREEILSLLGVGSGNNEDNNEDSGWASDAPQFKVIVEKELSTIEKLAEIMRNGFIFTAAEPISVVQGYKGEEEQEQWALFGITENGEPELEANFTGSLDWAICHVFEKLKETE